MPVAADVFLARVYLNEVLPTTTSRSRCFSASCLEEAVGLLACLFVCLLAFWLVFRAPLAPAHVSTGGAIGLVATRSSRCVFCAAFECDWVRGKK